MQSLIYQTKGLNEENEELRAQMLSASPSQSRQPRSQRTTLRRTYEASFPGNAEFPTCSHTMWSKEKLSPTARSSWMNAPTLHRCQQKGGAIGHAYPMRCEPD